MNPFIELKQITKAFGSVVANDGVNFDVRKGEIHALLGENGSGKSTLVNMLSGLYRPDSGSIQVDGKEVVFHSPKDAIAAGIGMVHQHFKLVEVLTARENITAGQRASFFIREKQQTQAIEAIGRKYGLKVSPDKKVYNMSVSEKQTVEIIKMLYRGSNILILDEPTAVLTPQEIENLFDILRNMRNEGCSIVIITHKLNEVMAISDRVTVLRKGKSIGTVDTKDVTAQELTEMMVGRRINLNIERAQVDPAIVRPLMTVTDLCLHGSIDTRSLEHLNFTVNSGEILGVAGIAGSGQKELCEIIAGLLRADAGSIVFKGEEILGMSPRQIIRLGISMSFVPEDRLGMGLVAGMDLVSNVLLKSYQGGEGLFVDRKSGRRVAENIVDTFSVDTPGVGHIVSKLSGGNIQKVLLGREIALNPELLITAYPVRGLDIGTSYHIYDILNSKKQEGVGILFVGEDLDVLLELSDRLMVLSHGTVMGIVDPTKVSKKAVGMMMLGRSAEEIDEMPHQDEEVLHA
jgi:simple sugar transport system ATP-binding protein